MEANMKQTLERPRSAKMFDQCQEVLCPLFEMEVTPTEAPEPRRPKHNRTGGLMTGPTLAQRNINGIGLDLAALALAE
jgi:hypothetical protein